MTFQLYFRCWFFLFISSVNIYGAVMRKSIDDSILEIIRNSYYASVEDENKLEKLEEFIRQNFSDSISQYPSIVLAYYGGVEALKAKHAFWPFEKLSYFNSSMDILKTAVAKEPENLEIRFIRFSILDHVPGILGYSEERETDKDEIVFLLYRKNYSELKESIQNGIVEYMLNSERLSKEQINILKKNFPGIQ